MKLPEKIYLSEEEKDIPIEYLRTEVFLRKFYKLLLQQEKEIGTSFENDFVMRFKEEMEESE